MEEIKRVRVQLTEGEIRTLLYHVDMELDSIKEVYNDLKGREGDKEEALEYLRQYEVLSKLNNKLLNTVEKL